MNSDSYRFLRVRAGITYFARVAVERSHAETGGTVHLRLGEANDKTGEVSATCEPSWIGAAMHGACRVLNRFAPYLLSGQSIVTITKIAGSPLDTREDVVEVAAAIATTLALGDSQFAAERLRVFRSCPLITPEAARSSLQMLAIARAMAVHCA